MLPNPVFLPGKSHGQRSLAGYNPWGHEESDTTWQLSNKNKNCFYRSFCFPSSFALFSLDSVSKFTAVFGFLLLCEVFYCRFFVHSYHGICIYLYINKIVLNLCVFFCLFVCLFYFKCIFNVLYLLALLTVTGLDIIFLHRWFTTFTVCLSLPVSFSINNFLVSSCSLFFLHLEQILAFIAKLIWWCWILLLLVCQVFHFSINSEWETSWIDYSWLYFFLFFFSSL